MAEFEISWQAPEHEFREKDASWYWLSIIVSAAVIGFSVWQKNFLFGLFIVVAEILFLVWGSHIPRIVPFTLNETELTVPGGKRYQVKDFESIAIDEFGNGWADLVFYARAKFKMPLKVLFPESRLEELRADLEGTLREIRYEPTVLDAIEKLLRF